MADRFGDFLLGGRMKTLAYFLNSIVAFAEIATIGLLVFHGLFGIFLAVVQLAIIYQFLIPLFDHSIFGDIVRKLKGGRVASSH